MSIVVNRQYALFAWRDLGTVFLRFTSNFCQRLEYIHISQPGCHLIHTHKFPSAARPVPEYPRQTGLVHENVITPKQATVVSKCPLGSESVILPRTRRISACGRACVKTQIQKSKVGNQSQFTDYRLNMWNLWVYLNGMPSHLLGFIPKSMNAK